MRRASCGRLRTPVFAASQTLVVAARGVSPASRAILVELTSGAAHTDCATLGHRAVNVRVVDSRWARRIGFFRRAGSRAAWILCGVTIAAVAGLWLGAMAMTWPELLRPIPGALYMVL